MKAFVPALFASFFLTFTSASKNAGGVVFLYILAKQRELAENNFIRSFNKDSGLNFDQTMAFAPHLFVFVIGFCEVLHYLDVPNSTDPVQLDFNNHAKEDRDHFLFILHDLALMELHTDFTEAPLVELFKGFYRSPDTRPAHNLVYLLISIAMQTKSPVHRVAMMEIIESTYPVMAKPCSELINCHGLYDVLQFFGCKHVEAEMSHAVGSWFDDEMKVWKHEHLLTSNELSHILSLVDTIYKGFSNMFCGFCQNQLKDAEHFSNYLPTWLRRHIVSS